MANLDMRIVLGGVQLPRPTSFKRIYKPNETDNFTLGGKMYTDFININRAWEVGWENMTNEDFSIVDALYFRQYSEYTYHMLQFDAYSLYIPVKMEISDQGIKYNGSLIENVKIILREQNAIS